MQIKSPRAQLYYNCYVATYYCKFNFPLLDYYIIICSVFSVHNLLRRILSTVHSNSLKFFYLHIASLSIIHLAILM